MNCRVLALLIAGHFVTDINTGALPAFLPFLKESLDLSYTMTATIILVFNLTSSVIQPAFGYLSDRWSLRWLLPAGPFLASLGLALVGLASSYAWILFFASLSGIGQASYHPEGFKAASLLSGERKATVISFFHFGGNLGFAVGPILTTTFFTYLGLKGSLLFLIPGIIMIVIFLSTSQWKVTQAPSSSRPKGGPLPPLNGKTFFPMSLLILTVVLRAATRLGLLTFVPFYFIKVQQSDPMIVGKYLSIFLLAGTAGIVIGGPLADRFGYKKTTLMSFAVSSVLLFLFYFTSGTLSLGLFSLAGMFIIMSNSVTMAIGQSLMPNNLGMASGLLLGFAMGIGGISTTILGWVADHWGVPAALQITFVLPILAFLSFLPIPYPPKQMQKAECGLRNQT
ncbi:MAG: MFS transporter [Syntrophaceae bacterium]|nr:MFS transporter [Syntrophaceae bacterium]